MKRGWLVLLFVSLGLNCGLLGAALYPRLADHWRAGGRGLDREAFADRRVARLAERLGLSPAEREELLRIRHETAPRIATLREGVWAARRELRVAYSAEPVDTALVRRGLRSLAGAQARVDSVVAEAMLRELSLMTPEQRAAYLAAIPWQAGRPHGPPASRQHGQR